MVLSNSGFRPRPPDPGAQDVLAEGLACWTDSLVVSDLLLFKGSARLRASKMRGKGGKELMVGYGGDSGSGGQADGEPFCGSLEALQDGSAVGGGVGGVSFALQGCGAGSFVC